MKIPAAIIVNFFAFELGWMACVLGAANGMPWLGLGVVTVLMVVHLVQSIRPQRELRLAGFALLIGVVFDSLLLATGWLSYPNGLWIPGLAPVWILAMWVLFATTLNLSMRWLHGRPSLAILMGAIFGPLSYLAGERLGAVSFSNEPAALTALAIGWGVAMPLLMTAAKRFDGVSPVINQPARDALEVPA